MNLALFAHGRLVETIFELLGDKENDMTKSVGWVLANSSAFRTKFANALNIDEFSENSQVRVQEYDKDKGKTDIEIVDLEFGHHIIIEAKRGFVVPDKEQLLRYAPRINCEKHNFGKKLLVVLAESDWKDLWLNQQIKKFDMDDILRGVSWSSIKRLVQTSKEEASSHAEKRLLQQFAKYLEKVTLMQIQYSNQVVVNALNPEIFAVSKSGESITWIDVVKRYKKYFQPLGGFFYEPPNYLAFRYDGCLKSVHHVESYEIVEELQAEFDLASPYKLDGNYYLFTLGNPIPICKDVRTNDPNGNYSKIYGGAKNWCAIDLLLSCDSIAEAVALSKER